MPKALRKPLAVVSLPLRPEDNKYLRTPDAAHHLGMSPGTLEVFRAQDKDAGHQFGGVVGPKFLLLGTAVRYLREDLDAWALLPGRQARKMPAKKATARKAVRA